MNLPTRSFIIAAAFISSGCANLTSIDRTTSVAIEGDLVESGFGIFKNSKVRTANAKAIHLDAEQRVVMVHPNGIYCAEPSPDALTALSASQGFGFSAPSSNSVSGTSALQETAAALSKRTQSTQLQREQMYRICEAYYNGTLNSAQVESLLSRGQELTTVILAIEQLTGAVASDQVALLGSSGATSAASLVSNQQALEIARTNEADAKKRFDGALEKVAEKEKNHNAQIAKTAQAKREFDTAKPDETSGKKTLYETEKLAEKSSLSAFEQAKSERDLTEKAYADTQKVTRAIEAQLSSAITNSTAAASGSVTFGNQEQAKQLDKESSIAIAKAVNSMVQTVLKDDRTVDACLNYIFGGGSDDVASQRSLQNYSVVGLKNVVARESTEAADDFCRAYLLRQADFLKNAN